jgi:DNA-binding NarL/FixJ family response regulator
MGIDDCLSGLVQGSTTLFRVGIERLRAAGRAGYADFVDAVCATAWSKKEGIQEPDLPLTASESQTLRAMAEGLSNKAIAERHNRALNTVKTQVSAVLRKLGAESRSEAVAIARRRNLIDK